MSFACATYKSPKTNPWKELSFKILVESHNSNINEAIKGETRPCHEEMKNVDEEKCLVNVRPFKMK